MFIGLHVRDWGESTVFIGLHVRDWGEFTVYRSTCERLG